MYHGERTKLEYVIEKLDGSKSKHIQLRLKVFPSADEIIFDAERFWRSGELTIDQLVTDLEQRPFPLYNISDDKMDVLIYKLRDAVERKRCMFIPCQLLSLAVLNVMDSRLQKDKMSNYFKTKYIKGLSMGRRSYAARILKTKGYIRESGNVWARTNKKFDQEDFWSGNVQ